ncbi:hypothetical protein GCM10010172_06560 [Paractinoplanes ferrugineus]|uniref:Uncharacterized protein n=1 Tax=Paractinoplanes ferrugineus TaxID=113564 RepID=A0A919J7K6_9ACTN|nr:hypothetical protein [Actinoplanes ferrugineus]GIE16316.1 hypothetical protein Afe05nite_81560 [Actinoplanes ferrugineus]
MTDEPLPFPLNWLSEAARTSKPLSVCPDGHLLVRERSCWAPLKFSADLRSLYCLPVEHEREAADGH